MTFSVFFSCLTFQQNRVVEREKQTLQNMAKSLKQYCWGTFSLLCMYSWKKYIFVRSRGHWAGKKNKTILPF
jgi:hypothetical protein